MSQVKFGNGLSSQQSKHCNYIESHKSIIKILQRWKGCQNLRDLSHYCININLKQFLDPSWCIQIHDLWFWNLTVRPTFRCWYRNRNRLQRSLMNRQNLFNANKKETKKLPDFAIGSFLLILNILAHWVQRHFKPLFPLKAPWWIFNMNHNTSIEWYY